MANSIPMAKTSYKLDYSEYNTGAYVVGNDDFGYSQPHAPRQIVEYPFDGADLEDPRTRVKNIKYDANGNQIEITETLGEVTTSLRKNLWDEENRLRGVSLKPFEANGPVAVYTYDAGGERIVRYNYDKMDAHSNALPLNRSSRDNVMLYPNGLLMAKALKVNPMEKDLPLSYTKHYYIGSERVSAKTGTMDWLGYYPSSWLYEEMPALNIDVQTESSQKFSNAATQVASIHQLFGSSLFALNTTDNFTIIHDDTHDPKKMDVFYFHPDHLGSSSYITNMRGMVSQHMEYLPFGELLVDEHKNSYNSPFKYNGKEFDEETGNYFYGARYYDPKWSIFISVDPLAEQTFDSYGYCYQNPVKYIDPDGRAPLTDFFNSKGIFERRVNDGKNDIKIFASNTQGYVSPSQLAVTKGSNNTILNVAKYYRNEMGISNEYLLGVGGNGEKPSSQNPAFTRFKANVENRMYLNNNGGYSTSLDDSNSFKSILRHENKHQIDNQKPGFRSTLENHAEVYLYQFGHQEFQNSPNEFKKGQFGSFMNYLYNMEERGTYGNIRINHLIGDFNDLNLDATIFNGLQGGNLKMDYNGNRYNAPTTIIEDEN